jgi:polyhydroxybutyrate depolymerase
MKLASRILLGILMVGAVAEHAIAQQKSSTCDLSFGKTSPKAPRSMTCQIGKDKREALVFAPIIGSNLPLIFAWHGHGGTVSKASQQMHLQTLWPEAIVVYPQGLKTETQNDPDGSDYGWQKEGGADGDRDLKFFDAMLTTLRGKYSIDETRIYTTGFSNGTAFSYLLWVERGNTLAAIGAVAGVLTESERDKLAQPRSLISIAGSDGNAPGAVQQTIETAKNLNHAPDPGQSCPVPSAAPPGTTCTLFQSTNHTPVKQISHPLGHVYPSWAPEEVVKFFKNHRRP